jgi:hypothetical protein
VEVGTPCLNGTSLILSKMANVKIKLIAGDINEINGTLLLSPYFPAIFRDRMWALGRFDPRQCGHDGDAR